MLLALAAETIMGPTHAHKYKHTHPRSSILGLKKENPREMELIKYLKQKTGMFGP